jgi:hypothetical protein
LARFLYEDQNILDTIVPDYFRAAFGAKQLPPLLYFAEGPYGQGAIKWWGIDEIWGKRLLAAGDAWKSAPPYPDVMSRVHREAFRHLAMRECCYVIVLAANIHARKYLDQVGFRPAPFGFMGVSRKTDPSSGLLAADPGDPALAEMLGALDPSRTYAEHICRLERAGFRVGAAEEEYIVRDQDGTAFFDPYCIVGVYSEEGRHLWRPPDGEWIRAQLNARLGDELVQFGSLDTAEKPPPLRPTTPVLSFAPDGNVHVFLGREELRSYFDYHRLPWTFTDQSPEGA